VNIDHKQEKSIKKPTFHYSMSGEKS